MTTPTKRDSPTVVVFAPIGRDGPASAELLNRSGMEAVVCHSLEEVLQRAETEADAVFIAEEGLFGHDLAALAAWVDRQPAWSDFPFVVLTSKHQQPAVAAWRQRMVAALRNVSLLERPVQSITLTSAMKAALRGRHRQYEVRALLEARERASHELEALVVERTSELEKANQELRTQMAERTRIEETLRQAQKIEAIGQLTGGIAHDFNNLLMVISGGLDMLDRRADPARRERLMAGMRQAAQRGTSLTRQLLAFSRRQSLAPESVDLVLRIGRMRELLDRSLSGDVHVQVQFAPDLWPVEVDPGELELVILNLAVNARDAMPDGGSILIEARNAPDEPVMGLRGDFVRLAVIDDGTGIPEDVRARVFDPFFTTKEMGKGAGLGLAMVYGFMRQSGGLATVDPEAEGGAVLSLYFPRAAGVTERRASPVQPARKGGAERVLMVEDQEDVGDLGRSMLEDLGYDVVLTRSAREALDYLAGDSDFQLLFTDILMPGGMNGVALAQAVRRDYPRLSVLLTTGFADEAIDEGARSYELIRKPYRRADLNERIRAVLDRPGART